MNPFRAGNTSRIARGVWAGLRATAILATLILLALPGRAGDERAIKSRVAPIYPEIAKRLRVEGVVKVEATVDADGKVIDVKTLSGNHVLSPAAEDAVRKWRFAAGTGVAAVDVDVTFALGQ
jgi:TonB family protein